MRTAESNLDAILDVRERMQRKPLGKGARYSKGKSTAIMCANDWHVEGCVDAEMVGGINEFNLKIAKRRIDQLWRKTPYLINSAREMSDIRDMVLWLGGDLISGAIHEELEESNFLGPAEAVLYATERCCEGIDFILRETDLKRVTVVTSYGNHGRTTRRSRVSTGYRHSWEYLAYRNLEKLYAAEPRVVFKVEKGYHNTIDIQGHMVRFHHGDAVRYAGGVGGVTIPLRKKIASWNRQRPVAYDFLGHFHQFLNAWEFTVCGCLVGYDAYALSIGADCQPPTQTFAVIDKERGKVLTTPVFVD